MVLLTAKSFRMIYMHLNLSKNIWSLAPSSSLSSDIKHASSFSSLLALAGDNTFYKRDNYYVQVLNHGHGLTAIQISGLKTLNGFI